MPAPRGIADRGRTARDHSQAPVAQPDRVVASEAIGRGFESLRARHSCANRLCSGRGAGFILARGRTRAALFWRRVPTSSMRNLVIGGFVRNYDLEFLKKFSMVIGFLVLVTVGLMVRALYDPRAAAGARSTRTSPSAPLQRIAPVGAVYAGATGAAAQAGRFGRRRGQGRLAGRLRRHPRRLGDLQQPVHRLPHLRCRRRADAGQGALGRAHRPRARTRCTSTPSKASPAPPA